jgi:hypothetical protein
LTDRDQHAHDEGEGDLPFVVVRDRFRGRRQLRSGQHAEEVAAGLVGQRMHLRGEGLQQQVEDRH